MALLRRIGTFDPEAVALTGADLGQVAVPGERGALAHRDPRLVVLLVEQAELDAGGVLGEQGEVRAAPVPGRAQRKRPSRPDLNVAQLSSAPDMGSSSMARSRIVG